jgi:hypothetical protein
MVVSGKMLDCVVQALTRDAISLVDDTLDEITNVVEFVSLEEIRSLFRS